MYIISRLSCLGKTRTLTNGTRIRCATITPQGNFKFCIRTLPDQWVISFLTLQNYCFLLKSPNFSAIFFIKIIERISSRWLISGYNSICIYINKGYSIGCNRHLLALDCHPAVRLLLTACDSPGFVRSLRFWADLTAGLARTASFGRGTVSPITPGYQIEINYFFNVIVVNKVAPCHNGRITSTYKDLWKT